MSGLSDRDVERLAEALHPEPDEEDRATAYAMAPVVAAIRDGAKAEALAEALHPEFGYEWREPMPTPSGEMDDGGVIWRAVQQAKAEALAAIERESYHPGRGWNDYDPDEVSAATDNILTGIRTGMDIAANVVRALLDDQVSTQEKEK